MKTPTSAAWAKAANRYSGFARTELESRRRHSLGPSGQRNRRQHARCTLCTPKAGSGEYNRCEWTPKSSFLVEAGVWQRCSYRRTETIANGHSTLSERLITSGDFTTASALSSLLFILLYIPASPRSPAHRARSGLEVDRPFADLQHGIGHGLWRGRPITSCFGFEKWTGKPSSSGLSALRRSASRP